MRRNKYICLIFPPVLHFWVLGSKYFTLSLHGHDLLVILCKLLFKEESFGLQTFFFSFTWLDDPGFPSLNVETINIRNNSESRKSFHNVKKTNRPMLQWKTLFPFPFARFLYPSLTIKMKKIALVSSFTWKPPFNKAKLNNKYTGRTQPKRIWTPWCNQSV